MIGPYAAQAARLCVQELRRAGELRWGTDEQVFNQILCAQSHAQLRAVLGEYQRVAARSLEQSVRSETSGDLQMGLLTIGARSSAYLATSLHGAVWLYLVFVDSVLWNFWTRELGFHRAQILNKYGSKNYFLSSVMTIK